MLPIAVIGAAAILFVALGGSAVAKSLIKAGDIAAGAVTSKTIRNGTISPEGPEQHDEELLEGCSGCPGCWQG